MVSPSAEEFERLALPHTQAALTLARALVRSEADAEDVVQEAFLRAFKYFRGFSGERPRAWLLSIVRNEGYALLRKRGLTDAVDAFDDEREPAPSPWSSEARPETPESSLLRAVDRDTIRQALAMLPTHFREVLVLRELEDCAYREIAEIAQIPIGTVMSRLARGRKLLLAQLLSKEAGR